ncbi:MAG: TfoX/Sxy family protein [Nocardioides sp.]|nr:TfoX/Sxy family protein [Nocardioides sp.]
MAYDIRLAARIRDLLGERPDLREQRMFGGLGFLVGGNMAVAASSDGGILVRIDPAEGERLLATTPARPAVMHGRTMTGWLRVSAGHVRTDDELARWVQRGVAYAENLPPKR